MSDSHEPGEDVGKETLAPSKYQPLRTWPPLMLLVGMIVLRYLPAMMPNGPGWIWMAPAFGPTLCGFGILLWWLLLSRATWKERVVGLLGLIVSVVIVVTTVHKSMIGPGTTMLTIPIGMAAFGLAAVFLSRVLNFKRTVIALLVGLMGFAVSTLFRNDGMWGNFTPEFNWRWQQSPEELMMANLSDGQAPSPISEELSVRFDASLAAPEWPGFRGADRSGIYRGPAIDSNWSTSPSLLWKIPVGPAWSSVTVAGDFLFTQEQRGKNETVVCYEASTGKEVWIYRVEARFEESLGGAGPRATPTLHNGKLFAMGADGHVVRLDPKTGAKVWATDLKTVAERIAPPWGFSSSPLAVGQTVIVHAGGEEKLGTIAFDVDTGKIAWSTPSGNHTYSSPQLCDVNGQSLLLMATNDGVEFLDPRSGKLLLDYEWKAMGYRSLQPVVYDNDKVLIPTGAGIGTGSIKISGDGENLKAEELWISKALKPDYNDMVVFQDHLYGFDGKIFACVDAKTGEQKWKGGRYGKGQVLLLKNSGLLLVASEKGEAVLIKADPSGHQEVGRFQALTGKTWNHPVVIGDRLFIRNAQELACYRLQVIEEEK